MKTKLLAKITGTLRGKLSLWYLVSTGVIILLFLIATSILFGLTLRDQIDHHVYIAITEVGQIVKTFNGWERNNLIKNLVSTRGMTVVVLSPDGAPVLETNSPGVIPATEHQLQRIFASRSFNKTSPVYFTERGIRFAAKPIKLTTGKGILAVGYSTQILYATFIKMIGVVIGVLLLLVLPLAFIGYKLLKKQLYSLEQIADQAKSVTNMSMLSKRIRISSPTQELSTIQKALNSMLAKLENIFQGERKFFSDAAHALKTPLAILRSQIENTPFNQSKRRKEMIETIDNTNNIIEDLLSLSQIGKKNQRLEKVSLTKIMTDLSELASTLGEEKNLKVSSTIQANIKFKGDERLIQRALTNIVYNAVVYNKIDGTIDLTLKKSSRIVIIINDTGIGIKKDDCRHVFTRFFRGTNVKSPGSGLGLAISKAVVENFGGKISLSSFPNKGTTVTVIFHR